MRRARTPLAAAFVLACISATPAESRALGVVTLILPPGDSLRTATPTIRIVTSAFGPGEEPISVRLFVSTRPDFATLVLDTTVAGSSASIVIRDPLPERRAYYFRASARGPSGAETFSTTVGPLATIAWLTLVFPNSPNGTTIDTPTPRFVWRSIDVEDPPGPWVYDVHITNVATQTTVVIRSIVDTFYVPPQELDANTSYRWAVTARLQNGDSTHVRSAASFVITSSSRPPLTLLYQNFPNPFPNGERRNTCIWFDLSDRTPVTLEIRDLRGNLVRRLLLNSGLPDVLPAGQYGRASRGPTGCDPRFSWDGRADDGRYVAAGLYLLRLRTDRGQSIKKVYFKGP